MTMDIDDLNGFIPSENELANINNFDFDDNSQQVQEFQSELPGMPTFQQQPVQQEQSVQNIQPVQQQPVQNTQHQPVQQQPVQNTQQQPVQNQQSPLDAINNSFTPNVEDKKIVAVISPANYDNMIKILQVLTKEKSDDAIIIRQSTITQSQSDCIIEANMASVLKNKSGELVDLDIINPKKYIKLLEQFKSQDDIYFIDDKENSRFIVTNGEVRLFLPKQDTNITNQIAQNFDMSNAQSICAFEVDKDIRRIIKNLAKDQDYIDFLLQDNVVKAIHIPDTAVYTFPSFKNDEKAQKLDETNADLALRSSNFLPVEADNYSVYIITLEKDKYASVVDCKIGGKIDVRTTELCDIATGGNLLF
jgi:hypothetical protein